MVTIDAFPPRSSSDAAGGEDRRNWALRRLSVDRPELRAVLDCHPRLTLVLVGASDVGALACLAARALTGAGSGVHVELDDPRGRHVALFRPHGGLPVAVDVASGRPVPLEELAALPLTGGWEDDGAAAGVDVVARLCGVDQRALWGAAADLCAARALHEATAGAGADAGGPFVGLRPAEASPPAAQNRSRRFGRGRHRRPQPADRATRSERVYAQARSTWEGLSGGLDVDAALALRPATESAATILSRLRALASVGGEGGTPVAVPPAEVLADVVARVIPAAGAPAVPHIAAFPPSRLDPEVASQVLDTLAWMASTRQIVVVTSDPAAAEWARLETMARRAAILDLR